MKKEDIYAQGRAYGLKMALDIVKRDGIEGLEKEIRFRNNSGFNLPLATREMNQVTDKIKMRTIDTVKLLSIATLHDEFGMGPKRLQRFFNRFDLKAECIMADLATWDDYQKTVLEETGIDMKMHQNNY